MLVSVIIVVTVSQAVLPSPPVVLNKLVVRSLSLHVPWNLPVVVSHHVGLNPHVVQRHVVLSVPA